MVFTHGREKIGIKRRNTDLWYRRLPNPRKLSLAHLSAGCLADVRLQPVPIDRHVLLMQAGYYSRTVCSGRVRMPYDISASA